MSLATLGGKIYDLGSSRAQDVVDRCTAATPAVCELLNRKEITMDGRVAVGVWFLRLWFLRGLLGQASTGTTTLLRNSFTTVRTPSPISGGSGLESAALLRSPSDFDSAGRIFSTGLSVTPCATSLASLPCIIPLLLFSRKTSVRRFLPSTA